jgi:uncharacterized delta-60 repeat protein
MIGQRLIAHIFVLLMPFAPPLHARPGDADKSFGVAGVVNLLPDINSTVSSFWVAGLHTSGGDKVLVVGACFIPIVLANIPCLARLKVNGALDDTFNASGRNTSDRFRLFNPRDSFLNKDGTVSILGTGLQHFEQVLAAGVFDASVNGLPVHANLQSWNGTSIAYQGVKMLVGGECWINGDYPDNVAITNTKRYCLLRYSEGGSLDTTFGHGGLAELPMAGRDSYSESSRVSIDQQLRPVAAYACTGICLIRWTASGQIDMTFGVNGVARFAANSSSGYFDAGTSSILVQRSGRLLVAGGCHEDVPSATSIATFCVAAFEPDGSIDSTFGTAGLQRYKVDGSLPYSYATDAKLAPDGGFYLAGYCADNAVGQLPRTAKLCLTAHQADGNLRSEFGSGGKVIKSDFKPSSLRMSVDSRGKVVLATECSTYPYICVIRIHGNQSRFDLDNDNEANPETDGLLYLRYLLGFRDATLTSGALGTYAERTSATDISTYLSTLSANFPNCSASIVGAPGGPSAMLDGIVLLRAMFGLTGTAVTSGINFPVGTTRTTWSDIKAHLNANCGMALN